MHHRGSARHRRQGLVARLPLLCLGGCQFHAVYLPQREREDCSALVSRRTSHRAIVRHAALVHQERSRKPACVGALPITQRALKARNVSSRVVEYEEISHGKLDTHRHFVYVWDVVERGNGGVFEHVWPNKRLVLTMPARRSFCICARYYGLGSGVGFVLPVKALAWPHKRSVRPLVV
jgi:hypothetical protein